MLIHQEQQYALLIAVIENICYALYFIDLILIVKALDFKALLSLTLHKFS